MQLPCFGIFVDSVVQLTSSDYKHLSRIHEEPLGDVMIQCIASILKILSGLRRRYAPHNDGLSVPKYSGLLNQKNEKEMCIKAWSESRDPLEIITV